MRVFISYSGETGKQVAYALREWLDMLKIPSMSTFVDNRMQLGADWFPELIRELKSSDCGILCLTKENLTVPCPWLIFEAGALRIAKEHSFVAPLLFGVKRSDFIQSKTLEPLSNIQSTEFTESGMNALIHKLNEGGKRRLLPRKRLETAFQNWYPSLQSELLAILLNELPEELLQILKEKLSQQEALSQTFQENLPAPDGIMEGGVSGNGATSKD